MVSKLRVKIKIIGILALTIFSLSMINNAVTPQALLEKLSTNTEEAVASTESAIDVDVLDNSESTTLTHQSNISNEFLNANNLSLQETEDEYIVSGKISANKLNKNAEDVDVDIDYHFSKKTQEFINAEAELQNALDGQISNEVVTNISENKNIDKNKVDNVTNVSTNSKVTISPTNEEETISEKIEEKLEVIEEKVSIDKKITIGDKTYILGSIFTDEIELEPNAYKTITQDSTSFKIQNDGEKNILKGITFEWSKGQYANCKNIDEIIKIYGNPIKVGNKKFWNIAIDNEEIIISATNDFVEITIK